ncbi:hypothetical protein KDE12_01165 [Campylobacter sp. faydin G-105]|uniref:hypothetical protein n=1 Tax=Campylobacter anatolicus TaxID=2829105 RepID=UPI001BA3B101|nr:hypothetical protein [Campylobacter anatolicus]MBR8461461.1 hypothetical protein [Campylobacter anatolicus]
MLNFKFTLASALVLIALICSLWFKNTRLESEIKTLKNELLSAKSTELLATANLNDCKINLSLQNERIKALKTNINQSKIKERVVTKFKTIQIPVNDSVCETKLRYYESLFKGLSDE